MPRRRRGRRRWTGSERRLGGARRAAGTVALNADKLALQHQLLVMAKEFVDQVYLPDVLAIAAGITENLGDAAAVSIVAVAGHRHAVLFDDARRLLHADRLHVLDSTDPEDRDNKQVAGSLATRQDADFFVMVDGDDTYDAARAPELVQRLLAGQKGPRHLGVAVDLQRGGRGLAEPEEEEPSGHHDREDC